MDFDPRITSDGNGYGAPYGIHCNFHYGNIHAISGLEVFDEDAKNEEACVLALRRLIAKADADIHDLEDKLAIIKCQNKWTESENRGQSNSYEVCCAAFKMRIDFMTKYIQSFKDGNVLNEHDMCAALKMQRPAERIHDIIDALIKNNFSDPDEQFEVEDLPEEMFISSDAVDIDKDLRQIATTSESIMEAEEQGTVLDRLDKPTHAVSEESSSDAARYAATKDPIELRDVDIGVKLTVKTEVAATSLSEGKSGSLTSIETVTTQTLLQASNDEGISKSNASQLDKSEYDMVGSKIAGSGFLPLSAEKEMMLIAEDDAHDISVAADSISRLQNQGQKDPIQGHLKALEDQSQSISDLQITYVRKQSSMRTILKPEGQKVQKRQFHGDRKSNPSVALKAQKKIGKRNSSSFAENIGKPGSLTIEGRSPFVSETYWQKELGTEEDIPCGIPIHTSEVSGAKRCQPKGASRKNVTVKTPGVKITKDNLDAKETLASKSQHGIIVCLGSPHRTEVKAPVIDSDIAKPLALGSNSSTKMDSNTTESLNIDLASLKLKVSEDPNFLNSYKNPELKAILKHTGLHGVSKLKKEHLIEKVMKVLATL